MSSTNDQNVIYCSESRWLSSLTREIVRDIEVAKENRQPFWIELPNSDFSAENVAQLLMELDKKLPIVVSFRHKDVRACLIAKCNEMYRWITRHKLFEKFKKKVATLLKGTWQSIRDSALGQLLLALVAGNIAILDGLLTAAVLGAAAFLFTTIVTALKKENGFNEITAAVSYLWSSADAGVFVSKSKGSAVLKFFPL